MFRVCDLYVFDLCLWKFVLRCNVWVLYFETCLCLDLGLFDLLGGGVLSSACPHLILLNCESSAIHTPTAVVEVYFVVFDVVADFLLGICFISVSPFVEAGVNTHIERS